jgi:diguanylate cyclase (GGDEF)-like protein
MNFISMLMVLFVGLYTRQRKNRVMRFALIWLALLFALSAVLGDKFTLSLSRPSIKNVSVFGILHTTYYEGELGLVFTVGMLSAMAVGGYLLSLLLSHHAKTRDRSSYLIFAGLVAYFAGVLNDIAVAARVYSFVYLSEYFFMIVVLTGSYALLMALLVLYKSAEDTKQNLEKKIRERTIEIRELNENLKRLAERDSLTGIFNRRFFDQYLEIEVRRARNLLEHKAGGEEGRGMNFGLVIADIDQFKNINDTLGHPTGDKALVDVVEEFRKNIFSRDVLCRYGGDEFVVLFTRTSREGILLAAEKIRKGIDEHEFQLETGSPPHHITISLGVVIFEDLPALSGDEILGLADNRLLTAKKVGRNKVVYG